MKISNNLMKCHMITCYKCIQAASSLREIMWKMIINFAVLTLNKLYNDKWIAIENLIYRSLLFQFDLIKYDRK